MTKSQTPMNDQVPMTKRFRDSFLAGVGVVVLVGLLAVPFVPARAQGIVPQCGLNCTLTDLLDVLVAIYNLMLGLAASVALLFILIAGVRMLYWSFMEDSPSQLQEAKLTARRAVGGFIIVACAYLVVNTLLILLGVSRSGPIAQYLINNLGFLR